MQSWGRNSARDSSPSTGSPPESSPSAKARSFSLLSPTTPSHKYPSPAPNQTPSPASLQLCWLSTNYPPRSSWAGHAESPIELSCSKAPHQALTPPASQPPVEPLMPKAPPGTRPHGGAWNRRHWFRTLWSLLEIKGWVSGLKMRVFELSDKT